MSVYFPTLVCCGGSTMSTTTDYLRNPAYCGAGAAHISRRRIADACPSHASCFSAITLTKSWRARPSHRVRACSADTAAVRAANEPYRASALFDKKSLSSRLVGHDVHLVAIRWVRESRVTGQTFARRRDVMRTAPASECPWHRIRLASRAGADTWNTVPRLRHRSARRAKRASTSLRESGAYLTRPFARFSDPFWSSSTMNSASTPYSLSSPCGFAGMNPNRE